MEFLIGLRYQSRQPETDTEPFRSCFEFLQKVFLGLMYPFSCVLWAIFWSFPLLYLPHHRSENASKTHPKSSHDKFKTASQSCIENYFRGRFSDFMKKIAGCLTNKFNEITIILGVLFDRYRRCRCIHCDTMCTRYETNQANTNNPKQRSLLGYKREKNRDYSSLYFPDLLGVSLFCIIFA